MRRIRNIEALEILLPWNRKGFYHINIKYGLIPPRQALPGEDGVLPVFKPVFPSSQISMDDILNPEFRTSKEIVAISAVQSRD
ncbi:MAG: hypothetical protein NUV31_04000 [Dehalococcoidales bacterium]|jgi:hypothetical protein|nr:hypothetical protein [Dehalococcoidales bacterium]